MKIRIKNLRARTIIGIYEWERNHLQEIVINIEMVFDGSKAIETDTIEDTVNYKDLKKQILAEVEASGFQLLEKLADHILQIVMSDPKVQKASVEVDKPHALRFADSVSVVVEKDRS